MDILVDRICPVALCHRRGNAGSCRGQYLLQRNLGYGQYAGGPLAGNKYAGGVWSVCIRRRLVGKGSGVRMLHHGDTLLCIAAHRKPYLLEKSKMAE